VLAGYDAAPGYDLATGLGSVNAYNLVHNWNLATFSSTSTTLTLNNNQPVSITHGQSVPVTVAVTGNSATPTGDVSLIASSVSGQGVDGHSLVDGTASWSTTWLPGGSYTVTAHYAGDGVFGASNSMVPVPVNVVPEASNTTLKLLTLPTNSSSYIPFTTGPYGTKFLADVLVAGQSGFGTPMGTVSLSLDGNPLSGSYTMTSEGEAHTPNGIIYPLPGQHSVVANYSGDASFNAGSSPPTIISITKAPTSVSMDSIWGVSSTFGSQVYIWAFVQANGAGVIPAGTVTFTARDSSGVTTQLGSAAVTVASLRPVGAVASVGGITTMFPNGPLVLSVEYSGDDNYSGSVHSDLFYVHIPTTTTVIASTQHYEQGAPITFTAHVSANAPGEPALTGSVQFAIPYEGSLGTVSLINGQAQFSTTSLPLGNLSISAMYMGDNYYLQSSATTTVNVTGPDFTFATVPPNLSTITLGPLSSPSALVTLTITALNGYSGTINFLSSECSLPAYEVTCSISPTSVTGSGTTQVTIHTTAPHYKSAIRTTPPVGMTWGFASIGTILILILLQASSTRPRGWSFGPAILVFVTLLFTSACGGGAGGGSSGTGGGGGGSSGTWDPGTPAGQYTVNVTAYWAGGPVTHQVSITFKVQ
jgi:hypothetical protein